MLIYTTIDNRIDIFYGIERIKSKFIKHGSSVEVKGFLPTDYNVTFTYRLLRYVYLPITTLRFNYRLQRYVLPTDYNVTFYLPITT